MCLHISSRLALCSLAVFATLPFFSTSSRSLVNSAIQGGTAPPPPPPANGPPWGGGAPPKPPGVGIAIGAGLIVGVFPGTAGAPPAAGHGAVWALGRGASVGQGV